MAAKDAGFTLTELIAGLLVASLLIAGVVDIIRQYALTTNRVRTVSTELRAQSLANGLITQLERADPKSLAVTNDEVRATIGNSPVQATLIRTRDATVLTWSGPRAMRPVTLLPGMQFQNPRPNVVVLAIDDHAPPIAIVEAKRTQAFDCQFDTVSLECRQ